MAVAPGSGEGDQGPRLGQAGTIDEQIVGQEMPGPSSWSTKHTILVRTAGLRLDTFRDKGELVADGKLVMEDAKPVSLRRQLMAKCPRSAEARSCQRMFEQEVTADSTAAR
ncbi:MAG: hypothetical protein IPH80_28550 [Myxococcales bacterium]|nr:hypothetical protein [Myxococcales bacterium]